MKNELHLKIVRSQKSNSATGEELPDKAPWLAIWLIDGQPALSKEYVIFDALIDDLRGLVRGKSVTVHLYNAMNQPLLTISPDNVDKESLYTYTITIPGIESPKVEIERPLCPKCGLEAGLEPAHWESTKSHLAQWRWVCVECDFAVSARVESRFDPTGRLASREERKLRAQARERFSDLWDKSLMSRKEAYELLNDHFGNEKHNQLNFATLTTQQLLDSLKLVDQIFCERKGTKSDGNELREIYNAITHKPGEPT